MIKSALLKAPWLYEAVQRVRDSKFHSECSRAGSFSQHGEDLTLVQMLKAMGATGPFLDIGSNHPFRLSNTYLLYLNGWRGHCVDPLPRFSKLYGRWRPEDTFDCLAIGENEGNLPLFEFESDVLSTLDADLANAYEARGYRLRRVSSVQVASINSVLEKHGAISPLSLLSIDIEGYELPALKSVDLEKWRPAIVCLEAVTADGARNEDAIAYLEKHGYQSDSDLGLNMIFKRVG